MTDLSSRMEAASPSEQPPAMTPDTIEELGRWLCKEFSVHAMYPWEEVSSNIRDYYRNKAQSLKPIITRLLSEAEARGKAEERAAIVAWLRGEAEAFPTPALLAFIGDPFTEDCRMLADRIALAIEQGQHEARG